MSSIIPGYEYDIFISYRHNDNRSGWVADFVRALQEELAATSKEPLSLYFDTNSNDGLLETHNVDKSLESKLKCMIFIPILSQTYCDPKSYAWNYELLPFNKLISEDRFGKDIKLRNGNFAGRILPIQIHDLESEDVKLFEKETGNQLRSIELIFRTATGVNRPLRANEDHPTDNLNKTYFRDQVNKTANAINEIFRSLNHAQPTLLEKSSVNDKSSQSGRESEISQKIYNQKSKRIRVMLISVILFITIVFAILKIVKS
jgi:hypothetical protein